jgi:hypothetical protein
VKVSGINISDKKIPINKMFTEFGSKRDVLLTGGSHYPGLAFFSRRSGIGTLHFRDHPPIRGSSLSNHGCYHTLVSEIQPFSRFLTKNELY